MELPTTPDFLIGQMRMQTMREETYFFVASPPTPFADLDKALDILIPKLEAAQSQAGIAQVGPVVVRYYPANKRNRHILEIGVPVKAGTQPAGDAQVKTLPSFRCASLLYWGSLAHIAQAYETLTKAVKDAGLVHVGEGREWHYHFEGDTSPNNVIGLQLEIR